MKNDIDPQKPFVAEDGYEYEDFADYLVGKAAKTVRNGYVATWREIATQKPKGSLHSDFVFRDRVWFVYTSYHRNGDPYAAPGLSAEYRCAQLPGLARFRPKPPHRHAEGAGQPGAVQAPADPIHATD